ncbi:unnamed protein product, partial [Owenia fusiformis]
MELMNCPVPNLSKVVNDIVNITGQNVTTALSRTRFWSGLRLDGVKTFKNLTEALPNSTNTQLQVFPDLELGRLNGVFYANTWFRKMTLSIPVTTPSEGVSAEDMQVQVGDGVCKIQLLTARELICKLPDEEPGYGKLGAGPDLSLYTMARVGDTGRQYAVGHVRYVPMVLIVSLSAAAFLLLTVVTVCTVRRCKQRKLKEMGFINMTVLGDDGEYVDSRIKLSALGDALFTMLGDRKLQYSDIEIEEVLGQGQFGIVYKGIVHDQDVAIKTIKKSNCSENDLSDFMKEALVMKDFEHPNVLNLIGVALDNDIPYVILPHM